MKISSHLLRLCLGFVAVFFTVVVQAEDNSRVYVIFKEGQKAGAKALVQQAAGRIHHEFDELRAIAATLPTPALEGLSRNPNIELIEEDPPRFMLGQAVPYGIDMVQARDVWDANRDGFVDGSAPTGASITVGVIDSGVYTAHEDFSGVTFLQGYPTGWNSDLCHHGTHVVGTIAAANNGLGVVGVTPGAVSIYMVKVFGDDCSWTYSSTLLNAAQKCQLAGAKIISMSLGGGAPSNTEDQGFQNLYSAGILPIAAAGNDGTTGICYPAGYASVVSVAAIDQTQTVASFSQKNADVELAAPGVSVLSTVPYTSDKVTVAGSAYLANHLEYAAYGSAVGPLVDGGKATTVGSWSGKVVLVERGDITFLEKVQNVQAGGGLAAVIYNNAPGNFSGTLGGANSTTIPAISLSREDGLILLGKPGLDAAVDANLPVVGSGYAFFDGTSMATPHVSAVAALVWSYDTNKSNAQIRDALQKSAKDLGAAGRDTSYGYGLVQAKAALDYLKSGGGGGGGGDTTPPTIANLTATKTGKGGTFSISWTTGEASTSVVTFTAGATGTYTDSTLVTSHSMSFRGKNGVTYTFYVRSADAAGNTATSAPYTFKN